MWWKMTQSTDGNCCQPFTERIAALAKQNYPPPPQSYGTVGKIGSVWGISRRNGKTKICEIVKTRYKSHNLSDSTKLRLRCMYVCKCVYVLSSFYEVIKIAQSLYLFVVFVLHLFFWLVVSREKTIGLNWSHGPETSRKSGVSELAIHFFKESKNKIGASHLSIQFPLQYLTLRNAVLLLAVFFKNVTPLYRDSTPI